MSELEDKINGLLSNPEEMGKLASLASRLMEGGLGGADKQKEPEPDGLDPSLLAAVTGVMKGMGGMGKKNLANALGPYLGEGRRRRLEKAIRVAQVVKAAGSAFTELGGERDV